MGVEPIFIDKIEGRELAIRDHLNKGVKDFVAVGGDGTVNDVASLLVNTNGRLGIIPVGSGNGLARALGIPLDTKRALARVFSGNTRVIDIGLINGKPFFCTAGIGFDAICAHGFASGNHRRGLWNYVKIVLKNYFTSEPISLVVDGKETKLFSLTFANANQYGNNAYIAPSAILDDELLDCSTVNPHSKSLAAVFGFKLMNGTLDTFKYYENRKAEHFLVTGISDRRIHVDGEARMLDSDEMVVDVLPKALNVIV